MLGKDVSFTLPHQRINKPLTLWSMKSSFEQIDQLGHKKEGKKKTPTYWNAYIWPAWETVFSKPLMFIIFHEHLKVLSLLQM